MFNRSRIGVIALVVSLLLMLGAVVMVATSPAEAAIVDGFEYRINGGTVEITRYIGTNNVVIVPSDIGGRPVTSIGDSAFARANTDVALTSVQIPEGVTSIGDSAFYQCQATINIPATVTDIGVQAFAGCTGLTSVMIPSGVISIGDNAFLGCTNLNSLTFESPSSPMSIGASAFASCSALTSITIPDSVNSIGNGAFQSCVALTGISVDNSNPIYASVNGVLYNKAVTVLIQYPLAKPGDFTVPDGVTAIQAYAFLSSTGLTGVTIPGSVKTIGDGAFSGCTSLTRMEFVGDKPTTLGTNWITNNAGLTVYYHDGKAGFTTPTWLGIESIPIYDLIMITNFGTTSPGGTFEQGTAVNITATAPTANPGEKYVFKGWTGTGTGAYTGTDNPATFNIVGSCTETASWTLRYQVSFAVNAAEMGSTNPTGLDQWVDSGPLTIQATPSLGYAFTSWSSDTSSITFGTQTASSVANIGGPGTITATFRLIPISVTITSNPIGTGYVWVDGAAIKTPITYPWLPGSIHTVEAKDIIESGEKYLFTTWSDGGLQAHQYTVNTSSATITASFIHQYSLTMAATGGSTTPAVGTEWHEAGTSVTLAASPPPPGNGAQYGVQYLLSWTGSGSGSYSGPDKPSTTITVNDTITETAKWTKQYLVIFALDPALGVTVPAGPHWYDADAGPQTIQAIPNNGNDFLSWTSNTTSITINTQTSTAIIGGPGTITANFAAKPVSVKITSNPTGTGYVRLDGNAIITPQTFVWSPGDIHILEAITNVPKGADERYSFTSWSDGGLQVHSYTVTTSSVEIAATFAHQYLLTMASNGGSTTPAVGTEWHDDGSTVTLDATAPSAGVGERYVWNGWTGSGSGSYTGSNKLSTNDVTVNGPITETANWTIQYQVTFAVMPSEGGSTTPTGTQWLNAGPLAIRATNFTDYAFSFWSNGGTASITFTNDLSPSTVVNINGPGTITANFVSVRGITITSNPTLGSGYVKVDGNPIVTPQNYLWLSGSAHTIEAVSTVPGVAGERYVFNSWSDGGVRVHTYTVTALNATITAIFDHQFLLTMATNLGTTMPAASTTGSWQSAGSTVRIDAAALPVNSINQRYQWAGWTGVGSGNYTGASALPAVDIKMNGPITETAKWNLQYQVTMATNIGTTVPIVGSNWFNAGSTITLAATAPVAGPKERYIFNGWTGSGNGAYTGMDNPATNAAFINGPITETASWTLQKVPGASTGLAAIAGQGLVSLNWTAPYDGGLAIDRYVVFQDGVELKTVITNYATIFGLTNGRAYSFTVVAHNAIGYGPSPTAVVVTPIIGGNSLTLEITSPLSGSYNPTSSVMLKWNVSDLGAIIVKVEVSSELSQWTTVTGTSYLMRGLADGPHTLFVRVTDSVNNEITRSVPMFVDSSAPIVTIKTPSYGGYLNNQTVTFNWIIGDIGSGLAKTEISSDGTNWAVQAGTSNTATFRDGIYKFHIRATDNIGNVVTIITPFTIDTISPMVITKTPSGNAESTLITVNVTFSEPMNRASMIISVAGVAGAAMWNGNSVSFIPSDALRGRTSYSVLVNGTDLAGNPLIKTWTFKTALLGKISGVVHDYDGKVLANAIVKLIGRSTAAQTDMNYFSLAATTGLGKVQTTKTDAYGVYNFYDVAIGNYTLEVALPGYQVRSMDVSMTVAAVEAGGLTIDPRASPASLTDGILFFTVILVIAAAISGLVLVVRKRRSSPTGPKTVEKAPEPNGEELPSKEWGEAGKIE